MADADWGGHNGSRLGLDIGGTLAKLVFFESETRPSWCNGRIVEMVKGLGVNGSEAELSRGASADLQPCSPRRGFGRQRSFWGERDTDLSFYDEELGGCFHFLTFRSDEMERFVRLVEEHELHHEIREIFTTGGGAYKYAELFRQRLGVELKQLDELAVVVKGISWLVERPALKTVCWLEDPTEPPPAATPKEVLRTVTEVSMSRHFLELEANALFPFLLVNIGSGVSIVKVNGINDFERVSGSAVGGGTFWGLGQLLCPESCTTFAEAGQLACAGDAASVNLLVGDIYGGDYTLPSGAVLPAEIVASFFAKATRSSSSTGARSHDCSRDASLLQALTRMVSANTCQIAYLNARIYGLSRIVFTGNFLRQNPVAREAVSATMRRVSSLHQGKPFQALFLQHEGYFGALGSFLQNVQEQGQRALVCKRMSTRPDVELHDSPTQARKEVKNPGRLRRLFRTWRRATSFWGFGRLSCQQSEVDSSPCSGSSRKVSPRKAKARAQAASDRL